MKITFTIQIVEKKKKSWLESYEKFSNEGRSIEAIAMERNILSSTVLTHIIDAFEHGYTVDFTRLIAENNKLGNLGRPLPTFGTCKQFEEVQIKLALTFEQLRKEYACKKSVLANMGIDGLAKVLDSRFNELTPDEHALKNKWYSYINWWISLRATGLYESLLLKSMERRAQLQTDGNSSDSECHWSIHEDKFLWENRLLPVNDLS